MPRSSPNALLFMAKWPQPGRAKTRLSPPLSPDEAAMLARCFLLDTLDAAATADADRYLAFAPASARDHFRDLLGADVGLITAEGANLGVSLAEAMRAAFALGYQRAAVVASDIPHLPPERYALAFAALDTADVSLGPSGDGGYYVLAASRLHPRLFEDVAWSTERVFATTLERAAESGLRVTTLPPCDDVDTAADLPRLAESLRGAPFGERTRVALGAVVKRAALGMGESPVTRYVPPEQQLVVEVFVRDIARARHFYEQLGFTLHEDKGSFVGLTWEEHRLFLDERADLPDADQHPRATVRIMVPDVDAVWSRVQAMGAPVFAPITDQQYGIRDFTLLDPDGFGLRFGTWLHDAGSQEAYDAD